MAGSVFATLMRAFVVCLNLMPLYLMNYELNEWLENETDKKMVKIIFNTLLALNLLSYGVGTFKRPKVIPQMAPSDQQNYCGQCRNWKPVRTHHCSTCQICVPKMDHHCPWLVNCVGYHNYKAFFLFAVYQFLIGVVFTTCQIKFCFFSPEETPELTPIGTLCFWGTLLIA